MEKLSEQTPIGQETVLPKIELRSRNEAIIEGCRSVTEYDENTVCFRCDKISVRFIGSDLNIGELDSDMSVVRGTLLSVEFLN